MEEVKALNIENKENKPNKTRKLGAKRRWHWFGIAGLTYLTCYVVVLFFLLSWAFIKSIHQFDDYILTGASVTSFPKVFSFDSYTKVLAVIKFSVRDTTGATHNVYMLEMVFNAVLYASIDSGVRILVIMTTAYVLAKHDFAFNKVIIGCFYFNMLVPIVGTMSSGLKLHTNLGLMDTWLGAVVLNLHFLGGLTLLIYRDAFNKLSDGYVEAARLDGAGHYRIMIQIAFPLIKPLWVMGLMTGFIGAWNDYQTPLVYMPSHPTVSYGMYIFNQAKSGGDNAEFAFVPYKLAGFMLLLLPTTLFFLCFQKRLLGATTGGGGMKE